MDLKKQIWHQWLHMLHKQEGRRKYQESRLLEKIKESLPDNEKVGTLSLTELHVIQTIGKQDHMNVTSVALQIGVTKSAVSKITVKLVKKDLVSRYQLEDNQKEVFFRLTASGEKVFDIHEHFSRREEGQIRAFLNRYDDSQLTFIKEVMIEVTKELDRSWMDE